MKLPDASLYALQAVLHLIRSGSTASVSSRDIAQAEGLSERFLLKLLLTLVRAGILSAQRGPRGGYRLARPAASITLLDVIEAVEGPIRGHVAGDAGPLANELSGIYDRIATGVRQQLGRVRVVDLAKRK